MMEYFLIHECHLSLSDCDNIGMDQVVRIYEVEAWKGFDMQNQDKDNRNSSTEYDIIDEGAE